MKRLSALVPLALVALTAWNGHVPPFSFATGSSVRVTGTSNVHGWTCTATRVTGTLTGQGTAAALTDLSDLTVTVPVSALDCRNGTMNTNMRRAMNTSANPNIRFTMASATVTPGAGGRSTVSGTGQLTINGQTRPVRISATGEPGAGGRTRFQGSVPVNMPDFGITPPTAMMGTMRTGARVTVAFDVLVGQ